MKENDPFGWTGKFLSVIQNDERHFNAPGVRVPMLSLSRVLPRPRNSPYTQYHSSFDNLDLTSIRSLNNSYKLVMNMIDILEDNFYPVNKFKGEPFLSKYGLHIDSYDNPEGYRIMSNIIYLIDGTKSIVEIADKCNASFNTVKEIIDQFEKFGLVEYFSSPFQNNEESYDDQI